MPRSLSIHVLTIVAAVVFLAFRTHATPPVICTLPPLPGNVGDVNALINCIEFANGMQGGIIDLNGLTYTLTSPFSPPPLEGGEAGLPDITSDITIKNGTITAALGSSFRLINVTGNLNLHGVTLENGNDESNYPGAGGGAIYVALGGTIGKIHQCEFMSNQTYGEGGAIFLGGNVGTISDSTFSNNASLLHGGALALAPNAAIEKIERTTFSYNNSVQGIGGAIYITGPLGPPTAFLAINTIKDSSFVENTATNGGAIFISEYSTVGTIDRSTFSTNGINSTNTDGSGGAIVIFGGAITTLSNNTFYNNNAPMAGGALYVNGPAETIVISYMFNNTFNQNSAYLYSYVASYGGAIYISGPTINVMTNNTIAGNTASVAGAGIYNVGTITTMGSNIVAQNLDSNGSSPVEDDVNNNSGGIITNAFFNLMGSNANNNFADGVDGNIVGTPGSPIIPNLGALTNNGGPTQTMALLSNSPAIGTGSNPLGLPFDQRGPGFLRTVNFSTDIGAYQTQPPKCPCITGPWGRFEPQYNAACTLR